MCNKQIFDGLKFTLNKMFLKKLYKHLLPIFFWFASNLANYSSRTESMKIQFGIDFAWKQQKTTFLLKLFKDSMGEKILNRLEHNYIFIIFWFLTVGLLWHA